MRPYSEIMRNMNLELQGMNHMRPWEVAIEEYLHNEFSDLIVKDRSAPTDASPSLMGA